MYNKNVSEKVQALSSRMEQARDVEGFFTAVTEFYRDYGVGMFGLNKAFRIQDRTDSKLVFYRSTIWTKLCCLIWLVMNPEKKLVTYPCFVEAKSKQCTALW